MKFNKVLAALTGGALLCGSYACTDKIEPEPSPAAGNQEVYFPDNTSTTVNLEQNANHFDLTINRVNASAESTVALTSSATYIAEDDETATPKDASDIFTIPASVTFPMDVKELTLEVGVDFEKVIWNQVYNIEIAIDETQATPYGLKKVSLNVVFEPWEEWQVMDERGDYQQGALWDYNYATPVYYRKSLTNPDIIQYIVLSPFSDFDYEQLITVDGSTLVEIDGKEYPKAISEGIVTPIAYEEGGYYAYASTFWFIKNVYGPENDKDYTDADVDKAMVANDWMQSYYDPEKGRIYLYMTRYIADPYLGYWASQDLETLQLPGEFHDYYFDFNFEGNYVDPSGQEYAMVQIVPSSDIDNFSYKVVAGALSADELKAAQEELADDTETATYKGALTVRIPLDEEGDYTIVTVGYDEAGKNVCAGGQTFSFESVAKPSDFDSIGWCEYTDGIFAGLYAFDPLTWEVEIQEHKEMPGYYRLVKPYAGWPILGGDESLMHQGKFYLYLDAQNPKCVYLETSDLCVAALKQFPEPYVLSFGYYHKLTANYTDRQVILAGEAGTLKNDMITFPTAKLLLGTNGESSLYYANIDPENDTDDVTAGTGAFCVDLSVMAAAPKKKVSPRTSLPSVTTLRHMVKAAQAARPAGASVIKDKKEVIASMPLKRSI